MKTILSSVFNSEQSVDMTSKSGKRPLRTLTAQEKLDAIRRVHDGESKASVARDIGVPESTLRGWCKNESKISFMSQQTDDREGSPDSKSKRIKTDDSIINQLPYNLNMSQVNPVYSPTSSDNTYALDYSNKSDSSRSSTSPLDLQMKTELLKSEDNHHKATMSQPSMIANEKEKYERSRAELARMGEEFGLNKPENFSFANQFATWNQYLDLQTKIAQQQQQQQKKLPTTISNSSTTVCNNSYTQSQSASGVQHSNEKSSSHHSKSSSNNKDKQQFNESLYIYLQAHAAMLALCPPTTTSTSSNGLSSSASGTLTNSSIAMNSFNNYNFNGLVDPQTWLLQYFNKSSQHTLDQLRSTQAQAYNNSSLSSNSLPLSNNLPQQSAQVLDNQLHQSQSNCSVQNSSQYSQSNKQILYQELTKETETTSTDSENLESPIVDLKEKSSAVTPKSTTVRNGVKKGRQVLEMLFNNNNIVSSKSADSDEQTLDEWEALRHGEMFLKWLEECHPPASVTALQIIQFKNLLNNVRNGAEKKINKVSDHQKSKSNGK